MGQRYEEKCSQTDYLIELYEKHQSTISHSDRMKVISEILNFIKEIKEYEEFEFNGNPEWIKQKILDDGDAMEKECEEVDKEMGGEN